MIKKILSAINIFKPIEDVILKRVAEKGVSAVVKFFAAYYAQHEIFKTAGVTIDFTKLENWALPAAIGVVAAAYNWIKTRYKKS